MGTSRMPLKLGARRVAKNIGGQPRSRSSGAISSRAICGCFAASCGKTWRCSSSNDLYDASQARAAGNILLTYADDTPAMAALNHGFGTLCSS